MDSVKDAYASQPGDLQYHRQVLDDALAMATKAARVGDRKMLRYAGDIVEFEIAPSELPSSIGAQILNDVESGNDPVAIRADKEYVDSITISDSVVLRAQNSQQSDLAELGTSKFYSSQV